MREKRTTKASFEPGDTVSILQVVRNPAWLTPYLSCALVAVGLAVQFLMHLVISANETPENPRAPSAERNGKPLPKKEKLEPVGVAAIAAGGAVAKSFPIHAQRRNS